jgi:hypothetical protein
MMKFSVTRHDETIIVRDLLDRRSPRRWSVFLSLCYDKSRDFLDYPLLTGQPNETIRKPYLTA